MSQTTTPSGAEYDTATAKALCDAMDATIARSSDAVKAACGYVETSGADVDVLAVMDDVADRLDRLVKDVRYRPSVAAPELRKARTAVAALIARNAELEAQAPSALREKLRSCEEALQAVEADRDALRKAMLIIASLDPSVHSANEVCDEWGFSSMFAIARNLASEAASGDASAVADILRGLDTAAAARLAEDEKARFSSNA